MARDGHGFILTGPTSARERRRASAAWLAARPRSLLARTSVPGIFAAGDVRHGSVKRVAAGVGEGATAVQFIHEYLDSNLSDR